MDHVVWTKKALELASPRRSLGAYAPLKIQREKLFAGMKESLNVTPMMRRSNETATFAQVFANGAAHAGEAHGALMRAVLAIFEADAPPAEIEPDVGAAMIAMVDSYTVRPVQPYSEALDLIVLAGGV